MTTPPTPPTSTDHAGRFQFSLKQMFLAVLGVCAVMGVYSWTGVAVAVFSFGLFLTSLGVWAKKFSAIEAVVIVLMFGIVTALLVPPVQTTCDRRRPVCSRNLGQIGLALHNYHDRYGSFPPAVFYDERGRPMHSWRVLLLPFLERQDLYDQYRFDEPWDGPHNRQLHAQMPTEFRCPSDTTKAADKTSYVAIVGPGTAWPEYGARTLDEFPDGAEHTLLVVESHNAGICWLEPRDLDVSRLPFAVNSQSARGISSSHPGSAIVLRADGSTRWLMNKTTAQELQALISPDGGDGAYLPRK